MSNRLLIVDDDPLILRLMTSALKDYTTTTAENGKQALDLYEQQPFDAVICDLGLPDIHGFEVIQRIRQKNPAARVLIISGQDTEAKMIASLRENIVDYLAKPFGIEDLRAAVANMMSSEESIEVISAAPRWIELRVPASFQVVARLGKFFEQLHGEIDPQSREEMTMAFRELLNNAIEHGCGGDPHRRVTVCCLRMSRVILYRIHDPGRGFDPEQLPHAALASPEDPFRHVGVRHAHGMRSGGFGILLARGIADELIYNAKGNEVIFVRYLDAKPKD